MDKPLLELQNVSTGYGMIPVLHEINLSVGKGDIYALLGPNGGGKSTILKVCSRQIDPWEGSVKIAGRSIEGIAAEDLAKAGVCTIPEGKGIFPNLTVDEKKRIVRELKRGGGLAKRGMGQAMKRGGHVKSMGKATRGGGVAKR